MVNDASTKKSVSSAYLIGLLAVPLWVLLMAGLQPDFLATLVRTPEGLLPYLLLVDACATVSCWLNEPSEGDSHLVGISKRFTAGALAAVAFYFCLLAAFWLLDGSVPPISWGALMAIGFPTFFAVWLSMFLLELYSWWRRSTT